ncbi:MAG: hypothetical protein FWE63_08770 [Bacteroidales bacterium]|nr:hypothetical protein [Bacteroidales bacterium]
MKRLIISLIFCGFTTLAIAQLEYKGYSGGMFVHLGHIKSHSFNVINTQGVETNYKINNAVWGLGGKLTLQYGDYLRFGMEGYNSTATYGDHKSSFSIGWGGVLAEAFIADRLVSYYVGATLGGGRVKNVVITKNQGKPNFQISDDVLFRRYGVGVFTPYMGAEVKINDKLRAVIKMDYMLGFFNVKDDFGKGFRMHLGVMFRTQQE